MLDPFKRARANSARALRRVTLSTINGLFDALLAPSKPAKRKAKQTPKATTKTKRNTAKAGNLIKRPVSVDRTANAKSSTTSSAKVMGQRGAFKAGTHKSACGTRSYRLYVPALAKTAHGPLPLVVMMHGCGQSPEDFARGTGMIALAEEFGFIVLYPAQTRQDHLNRCWNWFKRADQERGAGEPALIASLTHDILAEQNADPAKVYVAGLSAGGAAALILATAYPDIFAAVAVHSGLAIGAAQDVVSAGMAMRAGDPGQRQTVQMPTIIFHGDADNVVNPRNGRYVMLRALEPYGHLDRTEKAGRVATGRTYTRTMHRIGKGRSYAEHWVVHGAGHAWAGGNSAGSYTDPTGPDASRAMVRFFLQHRTTKKRRTEAIA